MIPDNGNISMISISVCSLSIDYDTVYGEDLLFINQRRVNWVLGNYSRAMLTLLL